MDRKRIFKYIGSIFGGFVSGIIGVGVTGLVVIWSLSGIQKPQEYLIVPMLWTIPTSGILIWLIMSIHIYRNWDKDD